MTPASFLSEWDDSHAVADNPGSDFEFTNGRKCILWGRAKWPLFNSDSSDCFMGLRRRGGGGQTLQENLGKANSGFSIFCVICLCETQDYTYPCLCDQSFANMDEPFCGKRERSHSPSNSLRSWDTKVKRLTIQFFDLLLTHQKQLLCYIIPLRCTSSPLLL